MNVSRWRAYALALTAVGVVACSDRPAVTDPQIAQDDPLLLAGRPAAMLASPDPTAIPIGPPARVDFLGRAAASRHTLLFPLSGPAIDHQQFAASARESLARLKNSQRHGPPDPRVLSGIDLVERLLAADTPEETRAALGPDRDRIIARYSVVPRGRELVEHTASFRLDGRDRLRVVTLAHTSKARTTTECVDDPYGILIDPSGSCGYDPYFDPEPVVVDVAAMQSVIDATSAELVAVDAAYATSDPSRCAAERSAYLGAVMAFTWKAGETIWWAWTRNVPKTYTGLRDSSLAFGATYALFLRYKECMAGRTASDG